MKRNTITAAVLIALSSIAMGCSEGPTDPIPPVNKDQQPTSVKIVLTAERHDPVSRLIAGAAGLNTAGPSSSSATAVDPVLADTWVFTSATVDGQIANLAKVLEWENDVTLAAVLIARGGSYAYGEFNESLDVLYYDEGEIETRGNTFAVVTPEVSFKGTWKVSRNILTLSYDVEN